MPKSEDEDGEIDHSLSGQEKTPEMSEHDRRIHRQLLRNRNIKPSNHLAERMRKPIGKDIKKPLFSKTKLRNNAGKGVTSVGELIQGASQSQGFKMSDKAKRLLQLGGYE